MPITHDEGFSPTISQLVQAFNRCADGHDMTDVIEAAGNLFSAALHNYGAATGMSDAEMKDYARNACHGVFASVELNWQRQRKPSDIVVKSQ